MLSFEASKKVVKGSKKLKYAWKIYLDKPRLPSWRELVTWVQDPVQPGARIDRFYLVFDFSLACPMDYRTSLYRFDQPRMN